MNEMELRIGSDALMGMRNDADITLQGLLKEMVDMNASEGKLTITLNIELVKDWVEDYSAAPNKNGFVPKRQIIQPVIKHTVGSNLTIKSSCNGENLFEGYEMLSGEGQKGYVLRPLRGMAQQSIFDDQYQGVIEPALIEERDEFGEEDEFDEETGEIFMNLPQDSHDGEVESQNDYDEFEDFPDDF